MSTRIWERAADLPVALNGFRRPEMAVLPPGQPDVASLFTFMRDAELRFTTLRLRIVEVAHGAGGDRQTTLDVALRHPGAAKVTRTGTVDGGAADYDIWASDGATVRTYAARHGLGTERPVRRSIVGLDDGDLPSMSRVYVPVTALPIGTVAETFVHPAGFCQNVLATGRCRVSGTAEIAGREAVVLACAHPRTTEIAGDRADHALEIAVDRETGLIARLVETIGGAPTRDATVTSLLPDASLVPSALDLTFPAGTTLLY